MNQDTTLSADLLEKGFRTLAHDWRNVLNGINLQVLSAQTAGTDEERDADLAEINGLIASATKMLSSLTRKISSPVVHPTPYPTKFLAEDLIAALSKESSRLSCLPHEGKGQVEVDYDVLLHALIELVRNSIRHLPAGATLQLEIGETADDFSLIFTEEKSHSVSPAQWGHFPFDSSEKNRLGLGVYYARRVAEAHQGSLSFHFSPETSTLQTVLRLPLSRE